MELNNMQDYKAALLGNDELLEMSLTPEMRGVSATNPTTAKGWDPSIKTIPGEEIRAASNDFDHALSIGEGGSCTVFKLKLRGTICAVKVLSNQADKWEAEQFATEVELLKRVTHPNLCCLYASSTDGAQLCLVLEYMDGGSLDTRLVASPPLGWQQRTYIALCICRALVHLHLLTPPMIHRDVKVRQEYHISNSKALCLTSPPPLLASDFTVPEHLDHWVRHRCGHRRNQRKSC
jgi:hypothetical protein